MLSPHRTLDICGLMSSTVTHQARWGRLSTFHKGRRLSSRTQVPALLVLALKSCHPPQPHSSTFCGSLIAGTPSGGWIMPRAEAVLAEPGRGFHLGSCLGWGTEAAQDQQVILIRCRWRASNPGPSLPPTSLASLKPQCSCLQNGSIRTPASLL